MKCAVYTRKSSEEGLEQDFNSLAAQREACEAYISSQRSEGWRALKTHYDDGGFSGGTLERPGLRQLLEDVDAGRIQIVVVYKIDRLTRSLADFAKLVDRFDAHGVSIVAVTQPFNTTTSMGRLTLNVLLSFAQFEREITGERIRDKIAASKRKGLWMGGVVPLGYDVQNRRLVVNHAEAATVRHVFERYIALGSVRLLKAELDREGYARKPRPGKAPNGGDRPFARGALYTLLRNPVYVGKVRQGQELYEGQHAGIVDEAVFERAQQLLARRVPSGSARRRSQSLLAGLLFDGEGHRMSPAHTRRHQQRYRYYVSQQVLHGGRSRTLARVSAHEVEQAVLEALDQLFQDEHRFTEHLLETSPTAVSQLRNALDRGRRDLADLERRPEVLRAWLRRVDLTESTLRLTIGLGAVLGPLAGARSSQEFEVPIRVARCQHGKRVILEGPTDPRRDPGPEAGSGALSGPSLARGAPRSRDPGIHAARQAAGRRVQLPPAHPTAGVPGTRHSARHPRGRTATGAHARAAHQTSTDPAGLRGPEEGLWLSEPGEHAVSATAGPEAGTGPGTGSRRISMLAGEDPRETLQNVGCVLQVLSDAALCETSSPEAQRGWWLLLQEISQVALDAAAPPELDLS
jgi:DNA invertase Pin-like site-specific DNA recombinase